MEQIKKNIEVNKTNDAMSLFFKIKVNVEYKFQKVEIEATTLESDIQRSTESISNAATNLVYSISKKLSEIEKKQQEKAKEEENKNNPISQGQINWIKNQRDRYGKLNITDTEIYNLTYADADELIKNFGYKGTYKR